jgi:hypothetical protein
MVELLVHLENGVDRAFFGAGDVARDIHDAAQILVIDAALDRLAARWSPTPAVRPCRRQRRADGYSPRPCSEERSARSTLDNCGHRLPCGLIVDQADLGSRDRKRQVRGPRRRRRCRARAAFTSSTRIISLGSRVLDVPVRHQQRPVVFWKIDLICLGDLGSGQPGRDRKPRPPASA